MGRITNLITKRKKIEDELEKEAIVLQDELQNLVPPSLSQWKENEVWVWGELTSDGLAYSFFTAKRSSHRDCLSLDVFGFESVIDAKKKFAELDRAWKNLVKITTFYKEEGLKVYFRAS